MWAGARAACRSKGADVAEGGAAFRSGVRKAGNFCGAFCPMPFCPGKKRRGLRSSYGEKDGEKRQRGRPVPFLHYLGNIIQEAVNGDGCRASRKRRAMPDIPAGRMRRASSGKRSRSSQGGSGVFFGKARVVAGGAIPGGTAFIMVFCFFCGHHAGKRRGHGLGAGARYGKCVERRRRPRRTCAEASGRGRAEGGGHAGTRHIAGGLLFPA